MGTTTTRVGLYKPLSDGSELVNVSQDLNGNTDLLDLAVGFQTCTASTRPSTPYSGKPIFQSDTSYSTYFSNGTSPASASWVEIPNSSATFANNLKLASGKQVNINASGSSASYTALNAATSTAFISSRVTGDTQNRFLMTADGTMTLGPGGAAATDLTIARTGTSTLGITGALTVSSTFAATSHVTVGGDLKLVNGATIYRNALSTGPTTVANTTTETVIATGTIPAGDAVAGAIYRMTAYGVASSTGTPNFTITARLGGVAGTSMASIGASATASGISGRPWHAVYYLRCVSTGASAVWSPTFVVYHNLTTAAQTGNNIQLPNSTANQTVDSTVSEAMVLTWIWSAASSSNTATCTGVVFERVA